MNLEKIKSTVKQKLSKKKEIIAAYLYGSILISEFYEDIDIGILISDNFKPKTLYEASLAGELERAFKKTLNLSIPIDVRILNDKPLRFLFVVIKNSEIIFSNNDKKVVQFDAKIMKEYLDIKPHFEDYDNMRRLRYAN